MVILHVGAIYVFASDFLDGTRMMCKADHSEFSLFRNSFYRLGPELTMDILGPRERSEILPAIVANRTSHYSAWRTLTAATQQGGP